MASVHLEKVRKVYEGGVVAVKDVDIDIADKEFVVLVGPSGCGKSTTLRMVAGLEEISSGTISIDGKVVNDVAPKDRDIAMVFQNYALYPHMSVFDNMAFGLKLRKFPRGEITSRVHEAARILGIEEYLDRKPKALSGGQRQRVAVGRAIVRKPKVFLFDEPLSNLDAKLRVQMRTEISKLHTDLGATMIYVTHDQTEAMTMGDKIVVMKDGLVQQTNTPLNLYNKPANKFVAGFIGSPSMNFMAGSLISSKGLAFKEKGTGVLLPLPKRVHRKFSGRTGRELWLGLRPEHIALVKKGERAVLPRCKAKIEVVEPMGNEIFIHFTTGGATRYVSRVASDEVPRAGSSVEFSFDLASAHFFDAESEAVL
ncbi:MAG TPA: sn-glycerol-3-phosphate ABC transporter ATP-binding protein UgpC [Bacteroidota bacterium]|nr:sn-glycerol-3-phosphate ABC transporter ATP-binding protein UgpC [Bacteroidota bacterium]